MVVYNWIIRVEFQTRFQLGTCESWVVPINKYYLHMTPHRWPSPWVGTCNSFRGLPPAPWATVTRIASACPPSANKKANCLNSTLHTSINISLGSCPFSIMLFVLAGTFSLPLEFGKEKWDIYLLLTKIYFHTKLYNSILQQTINTFWHNLKK